MRTIPHIYLCGTPYTDAPHKDWKQNFVDDLTIDFRIFDPNPEGKGAMDDLGFDVGPEVVSRDKRAIESCDILVAYINKATTGSIMEIFHAHNVDTVTYVIRPGGYNGGIWMNYHTDRFFENPKQCSEFISNTWHNVRYVKS
tara:strand:- start:242 stop:667 length:426 start_codon:yes stop_codon:yes gene_type:complete